jgi:type III restriction enzyme
MQFKFDANQEFQVHAVEAITDLFEGQPRVETELNFLLGGAAAVPNRLDLDEDALLANLRAVQARNNLDPDEALACIEEAVATGNGPLAVRFPNFSVEMETGTGKTYVYLRTALELYRRYGFRKFIVVVPSVAIREGVLKTLQITKPHFQELYGNLPYRYHVYDSANLSLVRLFCVSDGIEIMVMTIDSFNKASNVMNQSTDRFQGETPIHLVQATSPILILDEPQNMESELRVRALAALNPLFALRYSATHRNPYNQVYRLTPYDAYRQGLVKKIEVAGIEEQDNINQAFLRLDEIATKKNTVAARLAIHKAMKDGTVKEQVITVKPGDNLAEKAERSEYAGFEVAEINPGEDFIRFANNVELGLGEARGVDKDAIFEAQIRYTVKEHFDKQRRLKKQGIKVLSLFFIDRVDNYAPSDGMIRQIFSRAFDDLKIGYPEWQHLEAPSVQSGYFAEKRRRGGGVELVDSVTGKTQEDEEAYDLIMRNKERLLSFEEPVSFIFSHSALAEGWDNPNVFQICTLNQRASKIRKRQEIGRGVRLAVDQDGNRVHDERVNVLTVVANASYKSYVESLQAEIDAEYGRDGAPPKPANARERAVVKLRKEYTLKPEFQRLWELIKPKTRYQVKIDTEALLEAVVPEIDRIQVQPPRVTVTKALLQVGAEDELSPVQLTGTRTALTLEPHQPLPNLVALMAELMEYTTPPMKLTRATLLELFKRTSNKQSAISNPRAFATEAVRILKGKLADELVKGIKYEKIDEWYDMTLLEEEIKSWKEYLVPAPHSVYDQVSYESEVERRFVEGLEARDDVKLYIKLPGWFTVDTPVGKYNPDWAIVMEERDEHGNPVGGEKLYLVRETKDTGKLDELGTDERRKVQCGERHFQDALGVSYKVVTSAEELP